MTEHPIRIASVCVFCGSGTGSGTAYAEAARRLGHDLALRGITLVYGGASIGLMGTLADAALEAGGKVVGVMPRHLREHEIDHRGLTEAIMVSTMHERKAEMSARADAFIALPGGFGTLEELMEALTWTQIGVHRKPCGLLDVGGFFDPLIAQIDRMVQERFVRPEHRDLLVAAPDLDGLLERFRGFDPASPAAPDAPPARRRVMDMTLVIGPTGVGKSDRAEALSIASGLPIVTLDRVQIFPELAVGSARPAPNAATGVERLLLTDDRRLEEGELRDEEAWEALLARIRQCEPRGGVILEGGSITVCARLLSEGLPNLPIASIEYLKPDDPASYRERVARRVERMIHPTDGGVSMLDELERVWNTPAALDFVETIVGYRQLAALCRSRGVTPARLADPSDREPVEAVVASHLDYAQEQVKTFDRLLAGRVPA